MYNMNTTGSEGWLVEQQQVVVRFVSQLLNVCEVVLYTTCLSEVFSLKFFQIFINSIVLTLLVLSLFIFYDLTMHAAEVVVIVIRTMTERKC